MGIDFNKNAKPLTVAQTLMNLSQTFREFFYSDKEDVVLDYIDDEGKPKHIVMPTFHNTLKNIKENAVSRDDVMNIANEFSKRLNSGDIRNKIVDEIQSEIAKAKTNFATELSNATTAASKADIISIEKELKDKTDGLDTKIDSVFAYGNDAVRKGFDVFNKKIENVTSKVETNSKIISSGMAQFAKEMEAKEKVLNSTIGQIRSDMATKMNEVLEGAGKDKIIADVKKAINVDAVIKSIMSDVNKKLQAAQQEFVKNVGKNYMRKDQVGSTDVNMNRGGKLILKKHANIAESQKVEPEGVLEYDSQFKTLVIHDGRTKGGIRLNNNVRKTDYSIGMSAHGYGSGPSQSSAETYSIATEAIKIIATGRTSRYYGGQGFSWKFGKTYAFGGHRDNNTIWDHATYVSSEASFDYHDDYVNATTSNEFDKSYVGTRNGNDHISLFNHVTHATTRAKFGYTMGNCTGGFGNSRDLGYLNTSGNNFSKFSFATDTPVRVNFSSLSMSGHDQASTHDLDGGAMQYGGNSRARMAYYSVALDSNTHRWEAIDHTGEGAMAGTAVAAYILGGYSNGEGGKHGQNPYINIFNLSTSFRRRAIRSFNYKRSSAVGSAW